MQVPDGPCAASALPTFTLHPSIFAAFTLIELLVVIAILGILAGLAVPALKNLGKSDSNVSAARQLLDDVGRARQLAMANRTTVYMVFVPTNFWMRRLRDFQIWWMDTLRLLRRAGRRHQSVDKQLSGYTFICHGAVGDQPGRHVWHYLAPWQIAAGRRRSSRRRNFMHATLSIRRPSVSMTRINGKLFSHLRL